MEKVLNANKYYEELKELIDKKKGIALVNNEPCACLGLGCDKCDILSGSNYDGCATNVLKWLMEEYKEKPYITNHEKKLLEMINPNYKYIARDEDSRFAIYTAEPYKGYANWCSSGSHKYLNFFNNTINFDFIKWEDENAWKIEDLLKLEVKDNEWHY